jgi:hypothetical protein
MTMRQLRELFGVGRDLQEPPFADAAEVKRELLELQLARSLPPDKTQIEQLPDGLGHLCQVMGAGAGDVIGEILQNPSSDLRTVRGIKRYAKRLAADAVSREEHDIAAAVYYAAIAHALVFRNQRITRFPLPTLAETYSRLSAETWVSQELVTLFQQARAQCLKKAASG